MSYPKKRRSDINCGAGSSISTKSSGDGGDSVNKTCIIHFSDIVTSGNIILLSDSDDAHGAYKCYTQTG